MHGRAAVAEYAPATFEPVADRRLEKIEEWVTPGGEAIASYFRFSGLVERRPPASPVPRHDATHDRRYSLCQYRSA
jgi:hypothetical protein